MKDEKNIYKDISGFDMSYDAFGDLCREEWKAIIISILVDLKKKSGGKYGIFNKRKETYIKSTSEINPF